MVMAKGKATLGPIGIGNKSVKLVLEISKTDFFRNAKFFSDSPTEVDFVLGDMQMNISDFDEYREAELEDERRRNWLLATRPGRLTGTLDASGVVETVVREDENQVDITDIESSEQQVELVEQEQQQNEENGANPDEPEQESTEIVQNTGESEQGTEQIIQHSEGSEGAWMMEGGAEARGEESQEPIADTSEEPSKEAVEEYILKEKPLFEDINFDPELLVYKKEMNLSWMEVAAERHISSGPLQSSWSKYKKRVAELMKGKDGAA